MDNKIPLANHSDRIVQDSHLIPYSLFPGNGKGHSMQLFIFQEFISTSFIVVCLSREVNHYSSKHASGFPEGPRLITEKVLPASGGTAGTTGARQIARTLIFQSLSPMSVRFTIPSGKKRPVKNRSFFIC